MVIALINVLMMPFDHFGLYLALPLSAMAAFLPVVVATPHERALPLPARTIVAARLVGAAWYAVLPTIGWLFFALARKVPWHTGFDVFTVVLLMVCCSAIPFLPRRDLPLVLPLRERIVAVTLVAAVAALTNAFASTATLFAVTAVGTAAMLVAVLRLVPPAIVAEFDVDDSPRRERTTVRDSGAREDTPHRWSMVGFVLRQQYDPRTALMFGVLLLVGAGRDKTLLLTVALMTIARASQVRQRWLLPLPLTTTRRWWMSVGASVALALVCVGVGAAVGIPGLPMRSMGVGAPTVLDDYSPEEDRSQVPFEYWGHVSANDAPPIVAPWGETQRPYAFRAMRYTFFNPYSAPEGSSERFVEWQFRRATVAVYGREIDHTAYRSDRAQLPPRTTTAPHVLVLFASAIICYAFLLAILLQGRFVLPGDAWYSDVGSIATMLLVVTVSGYSMAHTRVFGTNAAQEFARYALFHLAERLQHNWPALIAIAVVPVLVLYKLAVITFAQAERMPSSLR